MIKCQQYTGSFMPVLHFSYERALLQKDRLKKINRMHAFAHTHKYR
jgi:hypothetical protein